MNMKRMKRIASLLPIMACLGYLSFAQENLWDTPEAYLGQPRPSDTPMVFAPGALADKGTFVMGRVAFSRDGKEFYYTQSDSWETGEHNTMKMIRYSNHQWNKPVVLNHKILSPTLSLDGNTLYMRPAFDESSMRKVWKSQRIGDGWSTPTPFLEEPYGVYDFMPTASG